MTPRPFGTLPSGEPVEAYTLTNNAGASVQVLTYGGIVTSLRVPDRANRMADVVLGFGDLGGYLGSRGYFGAIIGRIAGRVSDGHISVEGRTYSLASNDGANHLHGGARGLDRRIWDAEPSRAGDGGSSLRLSYSSPDGEEGYPGTVDISVTYTLTASNAFIVETESTADRPTPLSLGQHSYFNLAGDGSGTVMDHEFTILADDYVPAGEGTRLTDRREPVAGKGADFRRPKRLGDALASLDGAHGDLYLLGNPLGAGPQPSRLVARATDPGSGRVLEVFTDESCLQFYTGVSLGGTGPGKAGLPYGPHDGFCLECHGYPNATVLEGFGDILVAPSRPQLRRTAYAFSCS